MATPEERLVAQAVECFGHIIEPIPPHPRSTSLATTGLHPLVTELEPYRAWIRGKLTDDEFVSRGWDCADPSQFQIRRTWAIKLDETFDFPEEGISPSAIPSLCPDLCLVPHNTQVLHTETTSPGMAPSSHLSSQQTVETGNQIASLISGKEGKGVEGGGRDARDREIKQRENDPHYSTVSQRTTASTGLNQPKPMDITFILGPELSGDG
ncbi:uncharacterized protein BP5553_10498 [Venustampulla echinocandica]|uniref:Uncharacterized protein n=1 Tax=Venustampulla echinocandica TaxID=2656787 RepID=A0A370T9H1_9HELO|nr:uncharacterized protein BP5553_10498 [Venustampulla echinocandica]RDL30220.1 hypothetical protein BP5553_10498 [Venustampulla echinocandica]